MVNRIGDYGLIGDCHSAALVGRDGSIDWACFPRFDSPSVFCKILDSKKGGHFSVRPSALRHVRREYLEDTNVLITTFECERGVLELTDCMPVQPFDRNEPVKVRNYSSILRRLRCIEGEVEAHVEVAPRFEYAAFVPRFRLTSDNTGEIVGGADALWVSATKSLMKGEEKLEATWRLLRDQEAWVDVMWSSSHEPRPPDAVTSEDRLELRLDETIAFWKAWVARSRYSGDWGKHVRRSALVLKALTFAPSGAVVAAPTTSLPEEIGGMRNWDYRYTWIRDATLTLISLFILGFRDEAEAFKKWIERTGAGRSRDLQIMYRVRGERFLPEVELSHLAGHRGSRPVRIGNGAVKQLQLDCYGQLLEAAYLFGKAGGELTPDNWTFLSGLVDIVCERWREPDQGIWEIRDYPRHFVHSKLNCWVAVDRALRIAAALGLDHPAVKWKKQCDAIRVYLCEEVAGIGWFPQAIGFNVADAATLLVPAVGLLPTKDARVLETIQTVMRDLAKEGLVHRYIAPDGLHGGEGSFLLCSFWLLDCLTFAGWLDQAEELLERLLSLSNDVGLYAEEIDPVTGEHLGNFPQAFTHMALVSSCAHLSAARRRELPLDDGAHDYAELALERLMRAAELTRDS